MQTQWTRSACLVLLIALTAYTLLVFVSGALAAIDGQGDPEVIWTAVAILGLISFWLGRLSWRVARRLRSDGG